MHFYTKETDEIINHFKTDRNRGLSAAQVVAQRATYGQNVLPEKREPWIIELFIEQFNDPLIYILLSAATIIFLFGHDRLDAFIISGVLCFNAVLGTIQEARTRSMLQHLKKFLQPTAVVIRDGTTCIIPIAEIVPGDLLVLQEGQRVPADARIIEAHTVQVDESTLTGESGVVSKTAGVLTHEQVVSDQRNMLFKGTHIVTGAGKAIVVATGTHTQMGLMYTAFDTIQTDIPLKKDLEKLAHSILIVILCTCAILFVIGLCMAKPPKELLVMLTALFICVVPEGLPVVLTLVLTRGSYLMAKKQVLVKNMQAIEALGRTNVIIIDKTGTLTRNEMMVSQVVVGADRLMVTGSGYHTTGTVQKADSNTAQTAQLNLLATAAALLGNAQIFYTEKTKLFSITGDPTEAALTVFAQKLGFKRAALERSYHKRYEIPFDAQLQYHAAFFEHGGHGEIFIIGSPEKIFSFTSSHIHQESSAAYQDLLAQGLRALALAHKKVSLEHLDACARTPDTHAAFSQLLDTNFELLGMCGMQDTIRSEVADVIKQAQDAGIRVIMATGDHRITAEYVAKQVGIWRTGDQILDGKTLESRDDASVLDQLHTTTVFSRITPQHKVRLVDLFHQQHAIVAMTGDGVNDSLSLAAADLGIAMGNIGTEIAKEASDIVLLDDSFNSIVYAIEQGRHIFYTLKRVILYFFSTNLAEILIVIFALTWEIVSDTHIPLPLTAAQILWLNLITDGFLDMGLVMEKEENNLLDRAWISKRQTLIDSSMCIKMVIMALFMSSVSLAIFLHYRTFDLTHARTITLVTMAMLQWFNAFNCRSMTQSIISIGVFSNRWLLLAASFVLFLQILLLYTAPMQHIFKTVPLSLHDWIIVIAASAPILMLEELRKYISKKQTAG